MNNNDDRKPGRASASASASRAKSSGSGSGSASARKSAAPAEASKPQAQTYTVASGDSLSVISNRFYGDAKHWQKIYQANKDVIGDNPNLIRVGQVLTIPPLG
ncbi:MAG TPA: LysM peptidoglycan-binding domain-containing protein [Anaerolineae bacterium]|nr:LysM peptidoglycan-binding domain-containing protein [Anaerolineae bacterium]